MMYVIKTDEGYLQHRELVREVTVKIVEDLQQATVLESLDVPFADFAKTFDVRWLCEKAEKAGGTNPQLMPITLAPAMKKVKPAGELLGLRAFDDLEGDTKYVETNEVLCTITPEGKPDTPVWPMNAVQVIDEV